MRRSARLASLALIGMLAIASTACRKTIETNEPGPGGLPRGIVEGGSTLTSDVDYPLYEGAVQRAAGIYLTPDPIEDVKRYYTDLLGVGPEILDPNGEALTFETGEFVLVLLPLPPSTGGGTEIRFTPVDVED